MKLTKHSLFLLLAFATASLPAAAQDAYGKFTVAHETHWGSAVLPAGTYTVSLRSGPVPFVIVSSDPRNSFSIMAVAQYLDTAQCRTSSIELEQNANQWDVRSLCFASSLTAYFNPPEKADHTPTVARQVASATGAN